MKIKTDVRDSKALADLVRADLIRKKIIQILIGSLRILFMVISLSENRVNQILGTKYPVIQGAMAGISNSELVASVSNAGGLGTLQTALLDKEEMKKEIDKIQELTSKPFAVNFSIAATESLEKYLDIALEKNVEVFCLSVGDPKPYLDKVNQARVSMQVVWSADLATRMENYGFDLTVLEGVEKGGEIPIGGTSTFSLIPNAREEVQEMPLVAAGGIANEKTTVAAVNLGAEAVQMGTRFLASEECQVPENVKQFLVEKSVEDVVNLSHGEAGSNALMNKHVKKLLNKSDGIPEIDFKILTEKYIKGMLEGDTENGIIMGGQSVGLINEVKSVKEIVEQIGETILSHTE